MSVVYDFYGKRVNDFLDVSSFVVPKILGLENNNLYIENRDKKPLRVTEVSIGGFLCGNVNQRGSLGLIEINLNDCIENSGVLNGDEYGKDIWTDFTIQAEKHLVTKNLFVGEIPRQIIKSVNIINAQETNTEELEVVRSYSAMVHKSHINVVNENGSMFKFYYGSGDRLGHYNNLSPEIQKKIEPIVYSYYYRYTYYRLKYFNLTINASNCRNNRVEITNPLGYKQNITLNSGGNYICVKDLKHDLINGKFPPNFADYVETLETASRDPILGDISYKDYYNNFYTFISYPGLEFLIDIIFAVMVVTMEGAYQLLKAWSWV